jgi:ABC-2 type transport system ATP-binding protein
VNDRAVRLANLRHVYPARGRSPAREALTGVTFDVRAGELFGVLGPNGGGKTTLFRILSTALTPTAGQAWVMDHDVVSDPASARGALGVVFQNPSLDKKLTVVENLIHQGRLYGLSGAALRSRALEFLDRVGLADRAGDVVEHLSGGLQRRAEIAKGLLHRPGLLLMDEPTTGLDPGARRDLWIYLSALSREGVTVLVTTHLMEEAERCSRLAILDRGRLAALGTPEELKKTVGGEVVTVTTSDPAGLAAGLRAAFDLTAQVIDNVVRVERADGHRFVPQLVEKFPGLVETVQVGRPTLEDVFVKHTGHRFWAEKNG